MNQAAPRRVDWTSWSSAVLAVAATYFFFLIFAEFAFLALAAEVTRDTRHLHVVMLGLAGGGVTGAALAAAVGERHRRRALGYGFVACAISAGVSLAAASLPAFLGAGAAVGLALGWLTVTVAASLRRATGSMHLGLCIGCGTGLAYAACNIPAVFHATPRVQALAAAIVVVAASFLPLRLHEAAPVGERRRDYDWPGLLRWTVILMALVWMDSAAFYIIQHTEPLRAATWREPAALWSNAAVHLAVAVGAGLLLDRGRRGTLAMTAVVALSLAALVLNGVLPGALRPGWMYSAGVSAYSALLVEYPARDGRPWIAALVFAVAGWIGSGLGIGMAEDLNHIPPGFVLAAATVLAAALAWRARSLRRAALAMVILGVVALPPAHAGEAELIARGREVYIAEGCIHCHSQYVRPRSAPDVERWGPATVLSEALAARPPLFGTRRQGPDLAQVGNRRSAEWNRLHLMAPRQISPGSRMPSFAYLFSGDNGDGDALVAYLASLGRDSLAARQAQAAAWKPHRQAASSPAESRRLFLALCAQCHGPQGRGDGALAARLSIAPPNWTTPTWRHVPASADVETTLSRIIKFGLPGSPMAGHEYLPDDDIVGLARFVATLHADGGGVSVVARRP